MLTDTEQALIAIWKRYPLAGQRGERMMGFIELGLSETRATQIVNSLIDRPEAWEHDPGTVGRLSRLREARTPRRSG